jgi:hypothetical protein
MQRRATVVATFQRPREMHSGFKHCTVPPAKFSIVPLNLRVNVCESDVAVSGEWKIVQRCATQTETFA